MKKVIDKDGSVKRGLFQEGAGRYIVSDPISLNAYLKRKEAVTSTHSEINELRELVKQLQKQING